VRRGCLLYLGTELVTNGTFDDGTTDWTIDAARGTISWQPGVLRVTNDQATGYPSAYQALTGLTVGKVYSLSAVVRGTTQGLELHQQVSMFIRLLILQAPLLWQTPLLSLQQQRPLQRICIVIRQEIQGITLRSTTSPSANWS
jgi:hypothetical protein